MFKYDILPFYHDINGYVMLGICTSNASLSLNMRKKVFIGSGFMLV